MSAPAKIQPPTTPHYGPFPTWQSISGLGKTKTYELIGQGVLPTRKVGRRTLIDIRAGLAWLKDQPSVAVRTKQPA